MVRRRAFERSLRWAVAGGLAALAGAVLLGRYLPSVPRPLALVALVPSGVVFAVVRRRLSASPLDVAMEVDRRLDAKAAVVTAAELALGDRPSTPLAERVTEDARRAVEGRRPRDVVPPWTRSTALSLAATLGVVAAAVVIPVKPAVSRPHRRPPNVRDPAAAQAAREAAEALEAAALQDPAHSGPLRDVAQEARALARELDVGVPRETALARVDELERRAEEALAWAQDQRHRAAVDAALAELDDPATRELRDALSRGDLRQLDAATRALADRREAAARRAAEQSLGRAAEAARRAGAADLANALEEERDLLRRRGTSSQLARALAQALQQRPGARRMAEHLQRGGDGDLSRALDEAMREIDGALTPEERRRIAEAMARLAESADPGSQAQFERAGRAMTPEEARAAMRELLQQLRQGSLDRTRAGASGRAGQGAQGQLARLRIGLQTGRTPGNGRGAPGNQPGNQQGQGQGQGQGGGPGGEHDEGHSPTTSSTSSLARNGGFVAPVQGAPDPNLPGVPISTEWTDVTGEQATAPSEQAIRQAAPGALSGIEQTPVPQPYRDQVRTYFGH